MSVSFLVFAASYAFGLFIAHCLKVAGPSGEDRPLLAANPAAGMLVAFIWPIALLLLLPRVVRLKVKGKTVWQRKDQR